MAVSIGGRDGELPERFGARLDAGEAELFVEIVVQLAQLVQRADGQRVPLRRDGDR